MKKTLLLLTVLFAGISGYSQKWSLTLSGSGGANLTTDAATYSRNYNYDYDRYDRRNDTCWYQNSELSYSIDLGIRYYMTKWAYMRTGVGYAAYNKKYDVDYLPANTRNADRTLKTDGITIPLVAGFKFPNKSMVYPFLEIGGTVFFAMNNDFGDNKFYFGSVGKLGAGVNITEKIALELAFSSNNIYSIRKTYNDDLQRKTNNQHMGLGASLGLAINF